MPAVRIRLAPCVALIAAISAAAPDAAAQVPPGTAVVCTHYEPGAGTPGLFLVPLGNGPTTPVAITGLPPELQYTGPNTAPQGAAAVAYRKTDGAILVCTTGAATGPFGGAIQLFVLHLMNGNAVDPSRTQSILLGNAMNVSGAVPVVLPHDRILVAGGPFASGPMAGNLFAIIDTSVPLPTLTLLPNPPVAAGTLGGFAIDPTAQFLYAVTMDNINTSSPTTILHRLDLATNTACQIASWPNEVAFGVTCDDDGRVYVSSTDVPSATHIVHTVVPDGCNPAASTAQLSSLPLAPSGIALDRASGRFAVASRSRPGYAAPDSLSLIDPATGTATVIASPPVGGWGRVGRMGVAVHNRLESYGACSDGQDHYWFDNFPNPGGQPNPGNLGNPNFSLTMASGTGTALGSAIVLSFGRSSTSVLGIEILVDLTTAATQFVPPGLSVAYPLPVPPGLSGLVLFAQSVHLESGNVFAASRGLMLTL